MTRREEIMKLAVDDPLLRQLAEELLELEQELDRLRKLPKIKVHPKDPTKQKATPAARLYKECLQQYTNIARILMRANGSDMDDDTSPLRRWFSEHMDA